MASLQLNISKSAGLSLIKENSAWFLYKSQIELKLSDEAKYCRLIFANYLSLFDGMLVGGACML